MLYTGNHELYEAEVALQTFKQFSKFWGDRYLTSNVQIKSDTNAWEFIGQRYRYFTTTNGGLRVLAFGFLFNFTGTYPRLLLRRLR
jgi:2',3'-cyclic-nucleotide 2'-phosphodiesterase (5'-nucleotidase family)